MRLSTLTLVSSICIVSGTALALSKKNLPLPVVPNVDLNRYQGKWYEIARLPARFEQQCVGDVTAEYARLKNGTVSVVNTCKNKDGHWEKSKGVAKLKDKNGPNSKLKVTFFWPFYGDYWIVDLDPSYQWALVGTPNRRYLWILSRTPELPEATYQQLLSKARDLEFDVHPIIRTKQTPAPVAQL
jgi:apolipoprotein D and lipocalin family protein